MHGFKYIMTRAAEPISSLMAKSLSFCTANEITLVIYNATLKIKTESYENMRLTRLKKPAFPSLKIATNSRPKRPPIAPKDRPCAARLWIIQNTAAVKNAPQGDVR